MATYLRDVPNNVTGGYSISPRAITGNINGTPVDLGNGTGRCTLTVGVGLINTLTNLSFQVNESADNSTYTAISGAVLTILNTSSPENTVARISFDRNQRYVNTTLTATGSTVAANTFALVEQQKVQT